MPPRHAASASASLMGFPSGLYGKYKQATNFFLDWLLRVRCAGVSNGNAKGKAAKKRHTKMEGITLANYEEIVALIAREPSTLSPPLLKQWARALAACETAITLRARVALFFPSSSQDHEDSHTYFLARLRSWFKTLKEAETPEIAMANAQVPDEKPLDFSNYYAVLELPDDYFPASMDEDKLTSLGGSTKPSARPAVNQKRSFNDSFENDLNVELSFLFMELEELSEAVYDAFLEVKRQKKTLIEATAVAKVAMDCAESVIAKLQLRFPSIRTGHDVTVMINDRIPDEQLSDLLDTVRTAWTPRNTPSETPPTSQYVPGTIIADLLWVSRALDSFAAYQYGQNVHLTTSEAVDCEMYNEHFTPHYCTPDMYATPSFLMQQLVPLFNTLNQRRAVGIKHETATLAGWFLHHVDRFFTTHSASILIVFITICWIRSVAALQGNGDLGRTISLSIIQRWDLQERLRTSIAHGDVLRTNPPLHKHMEDNLLLLELVDIENVMVRANPLLAGLIQLDFQLQFTQVGINAMLSTTRFRAFAHIYNAMRDRQLLQAIPFIEQVLDVNERSMFTPSRAAAVHGSFTSAYYISSGMTEAAVDAFLHRLPAPPKHLASCVREFYYVCDLSSVFRLLKKKDYSVLPSGCATASWKTLLSAVSELCSTELFDSRIISRDMLKFSDDLTDLFNTLCDTLGRRAVADLMIADDNRQQVVNRVLEDVVAMPLLLCFDCLDRGGTFLASEATSKLMQHDNMRGLRVGGWKAVETYSRQAAAAISQYFAEREPADIEATYYLFPPVPQWRSLEFGDVPPHSISPDQDTKKRCASLLEKMIHSDGPMYGEDLEQFKSVVKMDPAVLQCRLQDPTTELLTLLHHAAAGPARDRRLVEWLLQMGAVLRQSVHCRFPPSLETLTSWGITRSLLFNDLAVHCAARAGLTDMVCLLLEADNIRDLNTVTFHTRESLLHIAVKHGHRDLYQTLHAMGANFLLKDASGKTVLDLTSDLSWKKQILSVAVQQRREQTIQEGRKSLTGAWRRKRDACAEKLRKELASQCEAERAKAHVPANHGELSTASSASNVPPTTAVTTGSLSVTGVATPQKPSNASSSKSKKKKKKSKKTSMGKDQAVSRAASLMQQIVVGGGLSGSSTSTSDFIAESEADRQQATSQRIEGFSRALDMLKPGSAASSAEREASAKQALQLVDALRSSTKYLTLLRAQHEMHLVFRLEVALEASRALFLLSKFYRQLPEMPRCAGPDLWQPPPDESTLSPLEKLIRRAGPTCDTDSYFVDFALHTAEVLASGRRVSQAKEIVELVERCLLKMKRRPPVFRKCVASFVNTRRKAGMEPAEGSTPEAQRAFEWYLGNFIDTDDERELLGVDHIGGYEWFIKLKTAEGPGSPESIRFSDLLDRRLDLSSVVFVDGCIVAGFDSINELGRQLEMILEMVQQCGHHLDEGEIAVKKVTLVGFEFSATGIVRAMPRETRDLHRSPPP